MNQSKKSWPSLAEIEREVVAESREWGRRRLQERLQELADKQGEVFPLAQAKYRVVSLRSELGSVKLTVKYGQDRSSQQWLCPLLRQWGLGPHQKITPAWAEKLCFTVTATGSYEEAAQVASKWGGAVDDSTLHRLVQGVGQRAEDQTEQRLAHPPVERQPQRPASGLAVLMVDGWMARFRGEGWGKRGPRKHGWIGTR